MKKIMILGASILQIPAIKKAKEMGLYVISVDMNPNAEGFKYADKKIVISTTETKLVLREAKINKIDGIMTIASDKPMTTVAKVCEELDLDGIDLKTAIKATNKSSMRKALSKHNVPIPMFFSVDNYEDYLEAIKKIKVKGYKCIIKPADNSGSRGIKLIEDFDRNNLKMSFNYCRDNSNSGLIMVEEYMEGPEVSVESISYKGKCTIIQITDKITTGTPYFVEMGHTQPSSLDKNIIDKICEITTEATKAIGINNGPSHTEIKVTKDGPKIVEIGARLGGDNITTHLVPYSTGVDMVELCIKLALAEPIEIKKKVNLYSAIRYKRCDLGTISNITGLQEAKEVPFIKDIEITHKIGEESREIRSSNDRVCFAISQAPSLDEAIISCETALNKINIAVENKKNHDI
ncbi:ATP-grasp domain-containing protein [Anaerococcus porci]|uniref:ATP-grasp domain-containing protein n=1 Tax=Anaerococcus porci TaxID=2652269 RepID=UPI002A75F3BE|nr:ATP-grasp domain-containing protein [Anaerococcus porci]MDY3006757.1 ATP-grasp domain-containing protein [Anaerococcus porci]